MVFCYDCLFTVISQACTLSSTFNWLAMSVCWGLPFANFEQLLLKINCVQCCGGFGNEAGDGGSVHLPPAKCPAIRPGDVLDGLEPNDFEYGGGGVETAAETVVDVGLGVNRCCCFMIMLF